MISDAGQVISDAGQVISDAGQVISDAGQVISDAGQVISVSDADQVTGHMVVINITFFHSSTSANIPFRKERICRK